jgi:hypothetical protein
MAKKTFTYTRRVSKCVDCPDFREQYTGYVTIQFCANPDAPAELQDELSNDWETLIHPDCPRCKKQKQPYKFKGV